MCVLWAALPCASLIIVLHVLQYLLSWIFWDPPSSLRLLRLPLSQVTSKDLSTCLFQPQSCKMWADHCPNFTSSGTALFASCLSYFFKRCKMPWDPCILWLSSALGPLLQVMCTLWEMTHLVYGISARAQIVQQSSQPGKKPAFLVMCLLWDLQINFKAKVDCKLWLHV